MVAMLWPVAAASHPAEEQPNPSARSWKAGSALALSEPGAEIRSPSEIQQGLRQCFQVREGQGLDTGLLVGRDGAAAAMQ